VRSGQQRDPKEPRAVSCRLLFARRLPAATGARIAVTNGRMQVAVVRDRRCRRAPSLLRDGLLSVLQFRGSKGTSTCTLVTHWEDMKT